MRSPAPGLLVVAALLFAGSTIADSPVVRLSEPVAVDQATESFGGTVPEGEEAVALSALLAEADRYVDDEVVVAARIGKVCQKKGCFFIARDGDAVVRVTFEDYRFFIPTDSGGKRAVFTGILQREDVTESAARHYAEDLGGDEEAVVEAGPAFTIVASAVRIGG